MMILKGLFNQIYLVESQTAIQIRILISVLVIMSVNSFLSSKTPNCLWTLQKLGRLLTDFEGCFSNIDSGEY